MNAELNVDSARGFGTISAVILGVFVLTSSVPADLGAQEPDTAEQVTLSFAWPVGMNGRVEGNHVRIRMRAGTADSTSIAFSYDMEVQESDAGLRIECSDLRLVGLPPGLGLEALPRILASLSPDYVVSHEGELLGVVDIDELIAEMRAFFYDSLDVPDSPQFQAIMDQFLTEEVLLSQLATEWNALVGNWAGAELELGAAYEYEAEEPIPVLGGETVLYRYELGIAARVPCTDADAELRCVELIQRSRPDAQALQALLEGFTRRLMEGAAERPLPAFHIKELDMEFEIAVITEPGTLIPHALSIYQQTDMIVEADGKEERGSDTRIREYRYLYPVAAGGTEGFQ